MTDKHTLGLPFAYQQKPEFFDALNVNGSTASKNALIEKLLAAQHVKTVLDMTCGTGSQVFYLAKRGYKVVGSDFSPALLEQARKIAVAEELDLTFIDGDMRHLQVGQFDAVITIFNAIGHLTKLEFEKALQNIHANLKAGGVYVFDIFNLQAITDDVIADFSMTIDSVVNGAEIRNVQHSELDREHGLLISQDHYTILKKGCEPEIHTHRFALQIYTVLQLQDMLLRNGFEVLHHYDIEGNDFKADKSLTILTVARKKV